MDVGGRAAEEARHDDELHDDEVDGADRRDDQAGARPLAGQQQEQADHDQQRGHVLAVGQRQHDRDGRPAIAARREQRQRRPQEQRRERQVVEVVEVRAVHRRVEEEEHGDEAGRPRAQVAARVHEERQRGGADQQRLQHQQRLRARRQPVEDADQIRDVRLVKTDVRPDGTAHLHRRLEQRPVPVGGVPDQVVLDAEVVAGRLHHEVVPDRDVREEDRVAEHGDRDHRGRQPGHARDRRGDVGAGGVEARAQGGGQQGRGRERDAHQRLQRQPERRRQHGERHLARARSTAASGAAAARTPPGRAAPAGARSARPRRARRRAARSTRPGRNRRRRRRPRTAWRRRASRAPAGSVLL